MNAHDSSLVPSLVHQDALSEWFPTLFLAHARAPKAWHLPVLRVGLRPATRHAAVPHPTELRGMDRRVLWHKRLPPLEKRARLRSSRNGEDDTYAEEVLTEADLEEEGLVSTPHSCASWPPARHGISRGERSPQRRHRGREQPEARANDRCLYISPEISESKISESSRSEGPRGRKKSRIERCTLCAGHPAVRPQPPHRLELLAGAAGHCTVQRRNAAVKPCRFVPLMSTPRTTTSHSITCSWPKAEAFISDVPPLCMLSWCQPGGPRRAAAGTAPPPGHPVAMLSMACWHDCRKYVAPLVDVGAALLHHLQLPVLAKRSTVMTHDGVIDSGKLPCVVLANSSTVTVGLPHVRLVCTSSSFTISTCPFWLAAAGHEQRASAV